jgi:hypothetical protein
MGSPLAELPALLFVPVGDLVAAPQSPALLFVLVGNLVAALQSLVGFRKTCSCTRAVPASHDSMRACSSHCVTTHHRWRWRPKAGSCWRPCQRTLVGTMPRASSRTSPMPGPRRATRRGYASARATRAGSRVDATPCCMPAAAPAIGVVCG